MAKNRKKIIVIIGATSSGKTKLAVDLAGACNGEVLSADSRQVYKYMDVGSGKDLEEYKLEVRSGKMEARKVVIPYHLIDVAHPNEDYDLACFVRDAKKAIEEIFDRGKEPIVAGGTHLWVQALVDGYQLPASRPDPVLRSRLEALDLYRVQAELKEMNPAFFERLHHSDRQNQRRLIRYIEVLKAGGRVDKAQPLPYDFLVLCPERSREELNERIEKRLEERLEKEDMLGEVRRLNEEQNVDWPRLQRFGLEYKYCALYLCGRLDYDEMKEQLARAIKQFAKRQLSWIRRWQKQGREIHFVADSEEALRRARNFLEK